MLDKAPLPHGMDLAHENFAVSGPDLILGGVSVRAVAEEFGTPAFIYDGGVMRRHYRALAETLSGFAAVHYSVKANPLREIIALFLAEGAGVEIASVGEYRAARAAGARPEQILFAGPGKRQRELEEVIGEGIGEIHLESFEEAERVDRIGEALGKTIKVGLRINPVPSAQAGAMRMGGKPTAFGFCEEDLAETIARIGGHAHVDLVGIHVYGGSQILDAQGLIDQWRHAIGIAAETARLLGRPLETIDLGGGLGIPYYAGEKSFDLATLKAGLPDLAALLAADPLLADARVVVEPGRFIAGPGGIYVAEINAVKNARGTRFAVTDGGMHHHLAASGNLGQIIKRNYPILAPARMNDAAVVATTVVGPLCTPLDTLGRDVMLPELGAGELVAVLQSGAYGPTASPGNFLSHPPAVEVLVEDGRAHLLER
ncbi:diaminopimelate decarboxylase [Devosia crocina]|uniref:Diaminopimelate decarboxylase n=1 Tax=Devosia crocina TaxID=429728 RepID=A0A1I7NRK3_9HYPH|nr:diaminopimelate decarboxylase [Devosia crocina]